MLDRTFTVLFVILYFLKGLLINELILQREHRIRSILGDGISPAIPNCGSFQIEALLLLF